MPQWVRGRNVVQFPFRAPPLEVKIPVVVSGQWRLSIDYLALKGHMDHKELVFYWLVPILYTSITVPPACLYNCICVMFLSVLFHTASQVLV